MLLPRIIPCLLIKDNALYKTTKFERAQYVGDPINAVRIFNEKEVDELIVLDIDATVENKEPDYKRIEKLAEECRMPMCYGGGIKHLKQAERIIGLGIEKVAISSAAMENPALVGEVSECIGSQSLIVVLDVRKAEKDETYEINTHNGKKRTGKSPVEFAKQLAQLGAGEIVVNSIDNDGMMKGYDINLICKVRSAVNIPITALGGAGSLQDIKQLISRCGVIGAAAGSLFVFKGPYRAVLITYPNQVDKKALLAS